MDKFIAHENIGHYTKQLLIETDPIKREMLQRLLAETGEPSFSQDLIAPRSPDLARCA